MPRHSRPRVPPFTPDLRSLTDPAAATITCTARDANGNVIPNGVTVPQLSGLGHWGGYLFPALTGQRGTIDCVSTTNIVHGPTVHRQQRLLVPAGGHEVSGEPIIDWNLSPSQLSRSKAGK